IHAWMPKARTGTVRGPRRGGRGLVHMRTAWGFSGNPARGTDVEDVFVGTGGAVTNQDMALRGHRSGHMRRISDEVARSIRDSPMAWAQGADLRRRGDRRRHRVADGVRPQP